MKIAQKNSDFFQKYHWLIAPLFAILAGYVGIDEYEKYQDAQTPMINVNVSRETIPQKNYTPDIKAAIQSHKEEFH